MSRALVGLGAALSGLAAAGASLPGTAREQAGALRRAAMDPGIDAERAALAGEMGGDRFNEGKAGPPHQRAVAKDPEIGHIWRYPSRVGPRSEPLPPAFRPRRYGEPARAYQVAREGAIGWSGR